MAKLFIPLPEDQRSGLISSKPQAEIEEGADPFLVDAPKEDKADGRASKATEAGAEVTNASAAVEAGAEVGKEENPAEPPSLGGREGKSELDTLLEANILEEEAKEPSKLSMVAPPSKEMKPGNAFWTEVNVNGENRSVLVKIKQVTIVEKMGDRALAATISSAVSSAMESVSTKSASGPFPFLKIQLPALSKIFRNAGGPTTSSSISMSSEKPGIFASLFRSESTTSAAAKTAPVSSMTASARTEKPSTSVMHTASKTPHPSTTGQSVGASNRISISIRGKSAVLSTRSKDEATKTAESSSRNIPGALRAVFTAGTKKEEKDSTSKSVSINEKVLTRLITAMTSAVSSSVSSRFETPKEQARSESARQKHTSSSVPASAAVNTRTGRTSASSAPSSASLASTVSAMHSTSSTKGEPTSLGDVFDILKNMPGSSKHSTSSTFIQGQFSFPKDSKLEKKVFKLSGYISS